VYQQYDIKKLNGEMAFSSTAMWWRIFRRWYSRRRKSSASASWIQSKCVSRPFPKTVRDAIAAWISSADFFVVEGRLWGPLEMLRALSAFE
jgi:hypothetical protein